MGLRLTYPSFLEYTTLVRRFGYVSLNVRVSWYPSQLARFVGAPQTTPPSRAPEVEVSTLPTIVSANLSHNLPTSGILTSMINVDRCIVM